MEENQVQEKVPVPEEGFWAKWKEKNQLKKQQKQEQKEIKKAAKEYSKLTKEQIYLKSLFEIEKIVNHCKQRGWTTKEDWRKNDIPMKEMVTDLIKKQMNFTKRKKRSL